MSALLNFRPLMIMCM